jgi:hypothetical protein
VNIHKSLGGGIIGTKSYLLLNLGRPDYDPADGGVTLARRWTKAVYRDLLCRDIPVIRPGDATPFVQSNPTAKTPPYRTNASCMQCHASIDPGAAAIRNVHYTAVPKQYFQRQSHVEILEWPATEAAETGVVDEDARFFKRPAKGKVFYRAYDGTMVNTDVTGVAAFGAALAETNDLYACAAARYFRHFTGVQVNLQDAGDVSLTPLSSSELAYRNLVIQLGQELKQHRSLRTLIQSILNLDLYKKSSMRLPAPP